MFSKTCQMIKSDEEGQAFVEYGLILALIFLAMIGGLQAFGASATTMWSRIATAAAAAMGG